MANYPPSYYPSTNAYAQQPSYYPQNFQPMYMPNQPAPMISGRMVTSIDEARGVPADLVGGVTVCPDLGHDVVYVKIFDRNTGTAPVVEYRRADSKGSEDRLDQMQRQIEMLVQMLSAPTEGKHAKEADARV